MCVIAETKMFNFFRIIIFVKQNTIVIIIF